VPNIAPARAYFQFKAPLAPTCPNLSMIFADSGSMRSLTTESLWKAYPLTVGSIFKELYSDFAAEKRCTSHLLLRRWMFGWAPRTVHLYFGAA
jgi:hypothetical protein